MVCVATVISLHGNGLDWYLSGGPAQYEGLAQVAKTRSAGKGFGRARAAAKAHRSWRSRVVS